MRYFFFSHSYTLDSVKVLLFHVDVHTFKLVRFFFLCLERFNKALLFSHYIFINLCLICFKALAGCLLSLIRQPLLSGGFFCFHSIYVFVDNFPFDWDAYMPENEFIYSGYYCFLGTF